jgi:hypothetical protein
LVAPSKTTPTSLRFLGLTNSNNTTTGLKRATASKDADMLLVPDGTGNLKRYHFDGTNWRSGLRTVADPTSVNIPAGGAFFVRRAAGSNFTQWKAPTEIVTDRLVFHYDAGNADSFPGSGTTWNDLSGNGTSGNLTNGPIFRSSNNGGIEFDGSNDYVALNSFPNLVGKTNVTVEAWFFNYSNSGFQNIIGQYDPGANRGWLMHVSNSSNNRFLVLVGDGLAFGGINDSPTNKWCHVVMAYDGTLVGNTNRLKLYLNGVERSFDAYAGGVVPSSWPDATAVNANIGALLPTYGRYFNGLISVVRIYEKTLNSAEILQNYNATKERFGIVRDGLVLHLDAGNTDSYPGNGTIWTDLTTNGNNGTLTNGPTFNSGNGGSIVFDGVDDNSTTLSSSTTNITERVTVAAWVKFNASLTSQIDHVIIISKENFNGNTGYRLSFRTDQGSDPISWRVNGSLTNGACEWAPGTLFNDLLWHYVVATYDKTALRIYVDNVLRASSNYSSNISLNTTNVTVGARLNGQIGQATIYNRALTAAEIEQNYNALRGRYGR